MQKCEFAIFMTKLVNLHFCIFFCTQDLRKVDEQLFGFGKIRGDSGTKKRGAKSYSKKPEQFPINSMSPVSTNHRAHHKEDQCRVQSPDNPLR